MGYPISKNSTAVPLDFLLILSSDHISPATGIATATVKAGLTIQKPGGSFAAVNAGGTVVEIGNGWYSYTPVAGEVDTVGPLKLHWAVATTDPGDDVYPVEAVNRYSANAFMTGVNGVSPPTNWNLMSVDGSGKVLLQPSQPGVTIPTVTTLTGHTPQTGDVYPLVDTEIAAIKAKTDNLPADPASNTQVNTRLASASYTAPDNASAQSAASAAATAASNAASAATSAASADSKLTSGRLARIDALTSASSFVETSVSDTTPAVGGFDGPSGLSSTDNFYTGGIVAFTSGVLKGLARKVTGYTGSSRTFAFTSAFPASPANGDTFIIIGRLD